MTIFTRRYSFLLRVRKGIIGAGCSVLLVLCAIGILQANASTTLLTDDFTGTTIDTSKWNELDGAGSGGGSGNIQQNGSLTIANSYVAATWGATALYSVDTFDSDGLEIQAVMTRGSDQLLGYGDYNFQAAGTKAFIIDLTTSVLALSWNNGSFGGLTSCGSPIAGATYKMKIISGGFEVYANGSLICTHNTGITIDDRRVFLESSAAASTFDDVLVTGNAAGPTAPGAPTSLAAIQGNTQIGLTWTAPVSNGGSAITDYLVEYKTTATSTWSTFADGVSTATSATVASLVNGTPYNFRVSAVNGVGTGVASTQATSTPTAPAAPDAPTVSAATAGNTQATVTFTPGASNGSAITHYTVTANPGGNTASASSSPITVTGLTNGQSYTFTVTATNAIGTSSASSASNAVTPLEIGNVLTDTFTGTTIDTNKWVEVDPTGIGGTVGSVTQNGSLAANGGLTGGDWGIAALYSADTFTSTSLEISADMTPGSNAQLLGYGDYNFDTVSSKAYILDITAGPGSQIYALSWENNVYENTVCGTASGSATANYKMKVISTGFEVYVNDVLQCTHTTATDIDNAPVFLQGQTTSGTFDNLVVYGFAPQDTEPDAPTIGTATAANGSATITFTPGANGGSPITHYTVTANPGGNTASASSSPITVTGLTNGQSYTFTVTATNAIGTSSASSASNAVTPNVVSAPQQVTGLTALGVNRQALLSWSAPASSSTITDYLIEYKASADATWNTFVDGTSSSRKTTVTGLTNGSAYDFRVSAISSAGTGTSSVATSTTPHAIENLAFVITGESNSGGIAPNSDATVSELASRSAVQIMNLTSGAFLFENLDIGTNNLRDHAGLEGYYASSHGLELQLANSVEAHTFPDNDQVYLVKTGHGGSQVSQWNVGGGYWTKFLQRTAAAKTQIPNDRQWIVWLSLGINDAIAGTPTSTWKTAMIAHIDKIKADLPGAIVIMTEFQSMPANSGYPTYNTVIREIAAEQPNVFSVDSTGAGTDGANHWLYSGMKVVGGRMVDVTRTQLGLVYPGTPINATSTPGNGQVSLSWTAPSGDGGSAITDYRIAYKESGDSTYTTFADGTATTTSATVTGLTNGLTYDFRVSAITGNGEGDYATFSGATNPDSDAPTISNISASVTASSTTITWTTNEAADSQVVYGLTRSYGATSSLASALVTSHSRTLTGLVSCGTYHFSVLSRDATANLSTSTDDTFTTACVGSSPVQAATSTQVTAASGGTTWLSSNNATATIAIPAGFAAGDAYFQIQQLEGDDVVEEFSAPAGVAAASGFMYHIAALTNTTTTVDAFLEPITVTLSYEPTSLSTLDAKTLRIYRWDGAAWHLLNNCQANTTEHTVTCTTTAFSIFGIFAAPTSERDSRSSRRRGSNIAGVVKNLLAQGRLAEANAMKALYPSIFPQANAATSADIKSTVTFTRDLTIGTTGEDVRELQKLLNRQGFLVAASGPGSQGNETTMFGGATKMALTAWQSQKGIAPATGYFGPLTRATINGATVPAAPQVNNVNTLFTRDLTIGATGEDVRALQKALNAKGFIIASTGPGSQGNETTLFGAATQAALIRFQAAHDIRPATGFFGPISRAALSE